MGDINRDYCMQSWGWEPEVRMEGTQRGRREWKVWQWEHTVVDETALSGKLSMKGRRQSKKKSG